MHAKIVGAVGVLAIAFMLVFVTSVVASTGNGVEPELWIQDGKKVPTGVTVEGSIKTGNALKECSQVCDCENATALKIDEWDNDGMDGEYDGEEEDDDNVITISNSDGKTFDWESEYPVCCVIVKASIYFHVFRYDGAYSDTGLYPPTNPKNNKMFDISHVVFCYGEKEENETEPGLSHISLGYEDLPINETNDFDYNDFLVDMMFDVTYNSDSLMDYMKITFDPEARGSGYDHDWHFVIPTGTFGTDATVEVDGASYGTLYDTSDFDLTIFTSTQTVLPPQNYDYPTDDTNDFSFAANTVDTVGSTVAGTNVVVELFFVTPIAFDLEDYDDFGNDYPATDEVGIHGDGLFFDAYLDVYETDDQVYFKDIRVIVVPTDWAWPQERAPVWNVYPLTSGVGVDEDINSEPVFYGNWWTVTPTTYIWEP